MEERRLASIAAELRLTVEELAEAHASITPGLDGALVGGIILYEDALFELSQ